MNIKIMVAVLVLLVSSPLDVVAEKPKTKEGQPKLEGSAINPSNEDQSTSAIKNSSSNVGASQLSPVMQ